jgi:hypothetical protein
VDAQIDNADDEAIIVTGGAWGVLFIVLSIFGCGLIAFTWIKRFL